MKSKVSFLIAFALLISNGCSAGSPEAGMSPSPIQPSEEVPSAPATVPSATQFLGEDFELTVSVRDDDFHSQIYLFEVGCLDSMPCIIASRLLFTVTYPLTGMSWSPDGHSLAFESRGDGSSDIFITFDEGRTIANLTRSQETSEASPQWLPDGKSIGYSARSSFDASKVLVSSPDGMDTKQILNDVFEPIQVTWSQNGMMSYSAFVSTQDGRYQLRILNSDGSLFWLMPLDESRADFGTANAAFSPVGNWLVYTGGWLNNTRVYLANLQTKTTEELFPTEKDCSQFKPSWSPDGNWLAFISNCESGDDQTYYLYLTSLSRKQKIRLDVKVDGTVQDAVWRPFSK